MKQAIFCEECKTEMEQTPPPLSPQIQNGMIMSTMAMINGRAECLKCGAQYVTQIKVVQVQLVFWKIPEESRIVIPSVIPPKEILTK